MQARWGSKGQGYLTQPVYAAIQKYGWDNIQHIIIQEDMSYKEAQILEQKMIIKFNSIQNGYNIKHGGQLGGRSWKTVLYNGKFYNIEDILQFSNVDGLTTHDITTRLLHGWTIEDILNKPKTNKNIKFEYNGHLYSAKELASISHVKNITSSDILNRIQHLGWDVKRAITQPKNVKLQSYGCRNKNKEFTIQYGDKTYTSHELELISNVEGLSSHNIVNRINANGWSVEDALNRPKKSRNKKYELNGKYYTSKELAELSPYENMTYHDITDRIRAGWSVYDAVYKKKRKSPTLKPKINANQQPSQKNPISNLEGSETNS